MRVLFAGGGTGGHLYPGIALAQSLGAGSRSFFLCTERAFDARELAAYGMDFEILAAPRIRPLIALPGAMLGAVAQARRRLRKFAPDLVVGLGGYGSFPTLAAATMEGTPYVLLEPNAQPGRANLLAARGARRIYTQWEETRRSFPGLGSRVVHAGSPLRSGLDRLPREEARRRLGLEGDAPVVGVIGGSQGADSLNRLVVRELASAPGARILHLAGKMAEAVRAEYRAAGRDARVEEFRRDMGTVYSACDLVISRAGALAIAELQALGCASVLVPYPHAAGDHQAANARLLARAGAAGLVDEREARTGALADWVRRLMRGDAVFDRMRRVISTLARPDSARHIVRDWASWIPAPRTWSESAASA
ncbi:MAG TPA: UDP-N-acetylglucosamine--N-acetylmuramyl-(pentapeptide) pyrophosphoryl-undecaprenol N-acetylglucosamine transferase [Planctomycetota bacterium]|nr:UDP-N-acetylglucosamine--N-acetylmuramyl-(pentapeptide) pyrophosphoryl-undecaprenol N-acetylglucosamine transferase [Planctomycetota bacterium]